MAIKYFGHIPANPNKKMILSKLGYIKGKTILKDEDRLLIDESIKQGICLCNPAGAYLRVSILSKTYSTITLDNGMEFRSEKLASLLKDSYSVIFMAATVGERVIKKVFDEIENGNPAKGLIIDSVASQTVDGAIGWIKHFIDRILARECGKLTEHRYSPGFSDLPLSYQKDIFKMLQLYKLDMKLSEKFMLIPEKSTIAIAGVEKKEE